MPARSVQVHFDNDTKDRLVLKEQHLYHGKWSKDDTPPEEIPPGAEKVQWGSQSNGIATGTKGYVIYSIHSKGDVKIEWDNPFAGGNSYDGSAPPVIP